MERKFITFIITALFILSVNLYSNTVSTYKVSSGDTLFGIAFAHNMSVDDFLKVNDIENYKNYSLKVGSNLKVYKNESTKTTKTTKPTKPTKTNSKTTKTTTYKVSSGDTLSGVAEKYSMGLSELYKLNNINSKYNLQVDDILKVYKKMISYKAKSGDTLSGVAQKYSMGLSELYELNNINSKYNLKVGDSISVYENGSGKTASKTTSKVTNKPSTKTNSNKSKYKVISGDTLFGIAFAHNMDVETFLKINNIDDYKKYNLKVGSTLNVYEPTKSSAKTTTKTTKKKKTESDISDDDDLVTYRVKKGDTLSEIALSHSMDTIEIYTLNNLSDNHVLQIGQKLKVYNKSRILYTKTLSNYKIKNGDNLYGVARKFGMNINELAKLNKIDNINTYNLLSF